MTDKQPVALRRKPGPKPFDPATAKSQLDAIRKAVGKLSSARVELDTAVDAALIARVPVAVVAQFSRLSEATINRRKRDLRAERAQILQTELETISRWARWYDDPDGDYQQTPEYEAMGELSAIDVIDQILGCPVWMIERGRGFESWLREQAGRDDVVGEVATDLVADTCWTGGGFDELTSHVLDGHRASFAVRAAFLQAVREFEPGFGA